MIIDSNNAKQKSILTNKYFYQTTAQIMRDFEDKGYANSADETLKVITALWQTLPLQAVKLRAEL